MSSLAYPLYARCLQTELCMRLVDVRNRASDRPPCRARARWPQKQRVWGIWLSGGAQARPKQPQTSEN